MNIIEYVHSYQYTFDERPFNDVDSLILCQLSYLKMKGLVPTLDQNADYVNLQMVYDKKNYRKLFADTRYRDNNRALVQAVLSSVRFQDTAMNFYIDILDSVMEIQFSAVTFRLTDELYYVAYRGTDENLVGWKEDFSLAFSEPVPCQLYAAKYLQKVARFLPETFLIGGHSKGGNLAVFAAMSVSYSLQERLEKVYCHDGPGFKPEVLSRYEYDRIKSRVQKILPSSSIVGMLMEQEEDYTVIRCDSFGIYQHDPFNWQVEENHFSYLEELDRNIKAMDHAVNDWILCQNNEQLQIFADILFRVLEASHADNLNDIAANWGKSATGILHGVHDLDDESKEQVEKMLLQLKDCIVQVAKLEIKFRMEEGLQGILPGIPDMMKKLKSSREEKRRLKELEKHEKSSIS